MSKIMVMMFYELKTRFQDLITLFMLALTPLALIAIIGFGAAPLLERGAFMERFSIGLVNEDRSMETRTILNHLENADELGELLEIRRSDYPQAIDQLNRDDLAAVILIPPNFGADLAHGRTTSLEIIPNHRRPMQVALVDTLLQSMLNLIATAYNGINTVYYYLQAAGTSREQLNTELGQSVLTFTLQSLGRTQVLHMETLSPLNHLTPLEYYGVSLSIVFLLLGGMSVLRPALNSGENLSQRLLVQGVTPLELIFTRFFAFAFYLALPFALVFMMLFLFVEGFRHGSAIHILLVSAASIAAAAALFVLISALFSNNAVANLAALGMIVFMSITGGSIIPLVYLPPWLEVLHPLSFNRWAAEGLYHAFFVSDSAVAVFSSCAVLSASTAISLIFSLLLLQRKLR